MNAPTACDLKSSIQHLAFEFYHFRLYGHLIQLQVDGRSPILHAGLRQAVGYGFLIHLRALLDFFYCGKSRNDDVLAADFRILPEFSSSFAATPWNRPPVWVSEVKTQLNKRLAHITSPRWKERAPSMDYYHGHFRELDGLISSFQAALPSELQNMLSAQMQKTAPRDLALLNG